MPTPFGGLQVVNNTTPTVAPGTPAKHTQGWVLHPVSQQGALDVQPNAALGRLVLMPGVYRIAANVAVDTGFDSDTSADAIGKVELKLYKGGSSISGAAGSVDFQADDRPQTISIEDIVRVTPAEAAAGTNYVELFWDAVDASGNDIIVRNAKFLAYRLD